MHTKPEKSQPPVSDERHLLSVLFWNVPCRPTNGTSFEYGKSAVCVERSLLAEKDGGVRAQRREKGVARSLLPIPGLSISLSELFLLILSESENMGGRQTR